MVMVKREASDVSSEAVIDLTGESRPPGGDERHCKNVMDLAARVNASLGLGMDVPARAAKRQRTDAPRGGRPAAAGGQAPPPQQQQAAEASQPPEPVAAVGGGGGFLAQLHRERLARMNEQERHALTAPAPCELPPAPLPGGRGPQSAAATAGAHGGGLQHAAGAAARGSAQGAGTASAPHVEVTLLTYNVR